MSNIFLGQPHYRDVPGNVADNWVDALSPDSPHTYIQRRAGSGFLARTFNSLLCAAHNMRRRVATPDGRGLTHFAMLHVDVAPKDRCWLDVLADEQLRTGADFLSLVLPIKSFHGLTSTAVENPATGEVRRLTMREAMAIPHRTFDAEQAGFPGWRLLASTGCWIMNLGDWTREKDERGHFKVYFDVRDRIIEMPNGQYDAETVPDDWGFCRRLHALGRKVLSTTLISAGHVGDFEFRNDQPWGSLEHDEPQARIDWVDDAR